MGRGPIPDFPWERPTVDVIGLLVMGIYQRNPVGCCLHIALDDGNLRREDLNFCLGVAIGQEHTDCINVASAMLEMTPSQRRRLYRGKRQ